MLMGSTHWMSCLMDIVLENACLGQEVNIRAIRYNFLWGGLLLLNGLDEIDEQMGMKIITFEFPHLDHTCGTCTWSLVGKPSILNHDHYLHTRVTERPYILKVRVLRVRTPPILCDFLPNFRLRTRKFALSLKRQHCLFLPILFNNCLNLR